MFSPAKSFNHFLMSRHGLSALICAFLCSWVIYLAQFDALEGMTLLVVFLLPCCYWSWQSYRETSDVLKRFGLQLDALRNEEYNAWHLAKYQTGITESLRQDVKRLATKMQNDRETVVQQEAVLLSVIEQLAIPVLVIDRHERIYSANHGFQQMTGHTRTQLIGRAVSEVGLEKPAGQWRFADSSTFRNSYRLYENHITKGERTLDIILCFSIEQSLRENEKRVWQRLLRVLNHEVRNSLTPISSIAQSLRMMMGKDGADEQTLDLLKVIEKRAQHLLRFVEAYSAFNRIQKPDKQFIKPHTLEKALIALNARVSVLIEDYAPIYADEGQLQQALINLIKNADEAAPDNTPIEVIISGSRDHHILKIRDQGSGLSNLDNLFVPFYSTKQEGNGIGLVLSRELVRQQAGELLLRNREDKQGAEALLRLPKAKQTKISSD